MNPLRLILLEQERQGLVAKIERHLWEITYIQIKMLSETTDCPPEEL